MGDPDLVIGALSVWVLNREFPEATNGSDEEWLVIRATMSGKGSSVMTEGPILMTTDFSRFRDQLAVMHGQLTGEASLCGYEPELKCVLTVRPLGGVSGEVEITADYLMESHRFEFGIDQSYLPGLISSCDAILQKFPVIGNPAA